MKFKQWFYEDSQQATGGYGDDVDPMDNNLYDPEGHERRPVPDSPKANRIFGVKPRPKDKKKKLKKSFLRTGS